MKNFLQIILVTTLCNSLNASASCLELIEKELSNHRSVVIDTISQPRKNHTKKNGEWSKELSAGKKAERVGIVAGEAIVSYVAMPAVATEGTINSVKRNNLKWLSKVITTSNLIASDNSTNNPLKKLVNYTEVGIFTEKLFEKELNSEINEDDVIRVAQIIDEANNNNELCKNDKIIGKRSLKKLVLNKLVDN